MLKYSFVILKTLLNRMCCFFEPIIVFVKIKVIAIGCVIFWLLLFLTNYTQHVSLMMEVILLKTTNSSFILLHKNNASVLINDIFR